MTDFENSNVEKLAEDFLLDLNIQEINQLRASPFEGSEFHAFSKGMENGSVHAFIAGYVAHLEQFSADGVRIFLKRQLDAERARSSKLIEALRYYSRYPKAPDTLTNVLALNAIAEYEATK